MRLQILEEAGSTRIAFHATALEWKQFARAFLEELRPKKHQPPSYLPKEKLGEVRRLLGGK